jgi:hypothetical protein
MSPELLPAAPCSADAAAIALDSFDSENRSSLQIGASDQSSSDMKNAEQSFPQYWASLQASRKPQRTEVAPCHKELEGFRTVCYRTSKTPILSGDLPAGYRILRCLPYLDIQGDVVAYEYCLAEFEYDFKPNAPSLAQMPATKDSDS